MAAYDIMPWISPHGGHAMIDEYPMEASATCTVGEPVAVDATNGTVLESTGSTAVADSDLMGIAMNGGTGSTNWKTGNAYTTNDLIQVATFDFNTRWITSNWTVAGSAFDDTVPATTHIGDTTGFIKIGDDWGVDAAPGSNGQIGRIIDILNGRKQSIKDTQETLTLQSAGGMYYIVFAISYHMLNSVGELSAPA